MCEQNITKGSTYIFTTHFYRYPLGILAYDQLFRRPTSSFRSERTPLINPDTMSRIYSHPVYMRPAGGWHRPKLSSLRSNRINIPPVPVSEEAKVPTRVMLVLPFCECRTGNNISADVASIRRLNQPDNPTSVLHVLVFTTPHSKHTVVQKPAREARDCSAEESMYAVTHTHTQG